MRELHQGENAPPNNHVGTHTYKAGAAQAGLGTGKILVPHGETTRTNIISDWQPVAAVAAGILVAFFSHHLGLRSLLNILRGTNIEVFLGWIAGVLNVELVLKIASYNPAPTRTEPAPQLPAISLTHNGKKPIRSCLVRPANTIADKDEDCTRPLGRSVRLLSERSILSCPDTHEKAALVERTGLKKYSKKPGISKI